MATAVPPGNSSFLPLLESLEDNTAGQSSQTDAYLTIANRLSGEEGRQFLPAVEKHFSRLGKIILAHISSTNVELSQAALQALGFCVSIIQMSSQERQVLYINIFDLLMYKISNFHSPTCFSFPETLAEEILSALCSLVVKSTDKNTCTRALWVISKQNFPSKILAAKVPSVLSALESVWNREDIQSVVMEHEALNVVIRMLEQVPTQMGEGAVRWAKLIIPLVVHSASKVRLRAAAALEMGMPLLLEKQTQVAAIIEPLMSTKLIPELQKLFMTKNETNVLKLWPLFVRLLGKLLHKGGPFINSLLHLEELGFRSSSPTIKKIAFLAWKSLIDNFALNPDILCSSKRMKLLMQPLSSINVRTEPLLLTKVEVWWYLVVQLGPNLAPNFDVVSVPLLQSTIGCEFVTVPGTPSRGGIPNGGHAPGTPKNGAMVLNTSLGTPRINLNSSVSAPFTFPAIQLLGLEMLLHYLMGPEVVAAAAKNNLNLSLEPLRHPFLSGTSSFTKHATVLITCVTDGVIGIGKDAPEPLLTLIWASLVRFVNFSIESVGSKKDRQGCEVLTLTLQALHSIVMSEALPARRVLFLLEATVKGIPPRVLGSASYQVGKMDVLNGTPALFLIQLLFDSSMLSAYVEDERFVPCLQTLVNCGLSGPTSPLAFGEAVLSAIKRSSGTVQNKEQLWKMWSVVVSSLTDTVTQSNEVNQGDALEHNFSAMYSALMFPITHLLDGSSLQQASQKSMLSIWSKLYKVFARCSALVITAEENICCEELCTKMAAALDKDTLMVPPTLNVVSNILQVIIESVDFTPYTPHFQQKVKSPHTPVNWMKKRNKVLGNLSTFQSLVVQCLNVFLDECSALSEATGTVLVSILSTLFSNLVLANAVQELLITVVQPLTQLYRQTATEPAKFTSQFVAKLEKLLSEALSCLQSRSTLAFNSELLEQLCPLLCVLFSHKNKHLRTTVAQFWNASFANSVSLIYPEELRPVLSQVKQKTPIILPGFEVVSVPDELGGQDSSECSQLETKLSGIPISSVGKRDSLLGKRPEAKDRTSSKTLKLVSTKLDFGSPKPPRRNVLEEEASVDFVFIPPETKERVLTEHQKEVKRTKRVDIPAMYNNLDASLDTTVFTQYTQSQEDSASTTEPTNGAGETEVVAMETQDFSSPKSEVQKSCEDDQQDEVVPESTDVSMEEAAQNEETIKETNSQANDSPNMSSDLLLGTPQKSRRQPFITLEKYADGKSSSPSTGFIGLLVKTSNSQKISPSAPCTVDSSNTQNLQREKAKTSVDGTPESPRLPKDGREIKGVKLTDRLPSDNTEDEDMIPDTQTETETEEKSNSQESQSSKQEEESDADSRSSQGEPRRSGRQRVRPLLPGEDPEERDQKFAHLKRKRSAEGVKADSQKSSSVKVKHNTRSKSVEVDDTKERLRTRTQREKELSQTGSGKKKVKLFSGSQDFTDKPERRKSLRESSQSDLESQSENESQSLGKPLRKSKLTPRDVEMDDKVKEKNETATVEQSTDKAEYQLERVNDSNPKLSPSSQAVVVMKKIDDNLQPSPNSTPDCISDDKVELEKEVEKSQFDCTQVEDANVLNEAFTVCQPQINNQNNSTTNEPQDAETEMQMTEELNQEDYQSVSSHSQSRRSSRKSKSLSDPAEIKTPEDQSKPSNSSSHGNTKTNVRTRRSMVQEDHTKSNGPTPENTHSQDGSQSVESESSQGMSRRSTRSNSALPELKESQTFPVVKRKGKGSKILYGLSPLTFVSDDKSKDDDSKASPDVSQTENCKSFSMGNSEDTGENQETEIPKENTDEPKVKDVEMKVENCSGSENPLPGKTEEQQMHSEDETVESPQQCNSLGMAENTASSEMEEQPEKKTELSTGEEQPPSPKKEDICEALETPEVAVEAVDVTEERQTHLNENRGDSEAEIEKDNETGAEPLEAPSDPTADELSKEEETKTTEGSQDQPVEVNVAGEVPSVTTADNGLPASPLKQRDLEAITGPEAGQSPNSRTKGTWSPTASPSTSILKKAQKRALEAETPSPLVKSRRVSFADPIQHQELADDIDRRSPALRTSSPRRTKMGVGSIPQPKFVTTPTKGLITLSPRNLNSPGYKSSKKCLISEMGQEPRPVSKDCIYPALVGCTAPVEAVLPQIASTMWSRGFGQIVRARNIKTVGDLSALTPTEVKVLPIRSPKISNVKKALKIYEQQRKGRGGDELKSFDETELMTSEVEEASTAQNQVEDQKTPHTLDLVPRPCLVSEFELLHRRTTPEALTHCTPQQLLLMHQQLADMMKTVVLEMHSKLSKSNQSQ
ncbi:hypothetical protein NL108_002477 [Boleophthalmus pectinirostris]|nr:hypothetical protein NL108_002477 [Boleophthalmus pectinirostris]